ncbi:hypothetical protein FB451DRAFT_480103 [Mycena latifolia]|nr:hypothetical protein FB451DRAFT_480103 [Mycena latifolia]
MSARELRVRLAAIEGKALQHFRRINELRKNHASVKAQLDVFVYPVRTLPVEIISEIFTHCLPAGNAKVSLSQAPFLLLWICRRWREIALSTPRLWSSLDIDVVKLRQQVSSQVPGPDWVSLAAGWLGRARSHRLSVTLRHPPEEQSTETRFQPDLAFLKQISHRLESLEVHGLEQFTREAEDSLEPLDYTPGLFPLLRRLVFGPATPGEDTIYDCWFAFFGDAPQLRELEILGCIDIKVVPLPWHKLTKFTGYDLDLGDCLEMLHLTPDLEECTFKILGSASTMQPVIHLRLKSLTILPGSTGKCMTDILASLTLPTLETLQLSELSGISTSMFEAFLSRSSAPLRTFTVAFDMWATRFDNWNKCFRLMPDLENLSLCCNDLELQTGFMKAFGTSEEQLLPRLRRLNLFRPSSRLNEVSAALAERRNRDPHGELLSVNVLWTPEDISARGVEGIKFL